VSPAIAQGIAEGRTHAEALHAADEGGFALSGKGSRTHKEAFWHRAALERAPQLMDPPEAGADRTRAEDGSFSFPAGKLFAVSPHARRRDDGPAEGDLCRPVVADAVVGRSHYHVINFADKQGLLALHDCGFGGVPCGNPQCYGVGGRWLTKPVSWSTQTRSPFVLHSASGLPEPMACVRQSCETCGKTSLHLDPIVLQRLLPVTGFLDALPFDASYQFCDIFLARGFTTSLT